MVLLRKNWYIVCNLFILAFVVLMRPLGFLLYLPSLSAMKNYFNVTTGEIQLTFTAYFLGVVVTQLIYGPLSDRFGRKKIIVIGISIFTISSFLCIFAKTIDQLLMLRIIQGIGFGCNFSVGTALLKDMFPREQSFAKLASLTEACFAVSTLALPFLGGYIQDRFDWQGNFVFMTLYSFVLLICLILFLKETNTKKALVNLTIVNTVKIYSKMYRNIAYLGLIFAATFACGVFSCFDSVSPFFTEVNLKLLPKQYGELMVIVGAAYLLGTVGNIILLSYLKIFFLNLIAGLIFVTGVIAMFILGQVYFINIYTFLIPNLLVIFATGILFPNFIALSMSYFPRLSGISSANIGFFTYIGGIIITSILSKLDVYSLSLFSVTYFVLWAGISLCYICSFTKQKSNSICGN